MHSGLISFWNCTDIGSCCIYQRNYIDIERGLCLQSMYFYVFLLFPHSQSVELSSIDLICFGMAEVTFYGEYFSEICFVFG